MTKESHMPHMECCSTEGCIKPRPPKKPQTLLLSVPVLGKAHMTMYMTVVCHIPSKNQDHLSDCTTEFLADIGTQTWSICYAEAKTYYARPRPH